MSLILRRETPADIRAVDELTREAFWGGFFATCDEHYLAHRLRGIPAFVPELCFVAEREGQLVGNIMYSRAVVTEPDGTEHPVLTFGPLSVLPAFQRTGVGGALVRHTSELARDMGFRAVIIYGHPDYYPRLGFCPASIYGITAPEGKSFDALMALPLYEGAMEGLCGVFHEDGVFYDLPPEAVAAYDVTFPPKEPADMPPIGVLLERLAPDAQAAFREREIKLLATLGQYSGREVMAWEGMDGAAMESVNCVLREYGLAEKTLP